jgi:hypothetical protein
MSYPWARMQFRLAQYDWSFKMRSWKYTPLLLAFARPPVKARRRSGAGTVGP